MLRPQGRFLSMAGRLRGGDVAIYGRRTAARHASRFCATRAAFLVKWSGERPDGFRKGPIGATGPFSRAAVGARGRRQPSGPRTVVGRRRARDSTPIGARPRFEFRAWSGVLWSAWHGCDCFFAAAAGFAELARPLAAEFSHAPGTQF